MKKNILLKITLSISLLLILTSCTSKNNIKKIEAYKCEQDGVIAPKWTCNAYLEDKIAAVGIAKMNAGNDKSFQKSEALADGRDALASRISTKVSNLFKSYKATTGSDESATYDKTSSKVSKQLANQVLNGSRAIDSWINPKTNELYLLVVVDNSSVKNNMKNTIKSSFKNEQALYQRFLESQANKELDFELSK